MNYACDLCDKEVEELHCDECETCEDCGHKTCDTCGVALCDHYWNECSQCGENVCEFYCHECETCEDCGHEECSYCGEWICKHPTCSNCEELPCECTCDACHECGLKDCSCHVSQDDVSEEWGIDRRLDLRREGADFYLLMLLTLDGDDPYVRFLFENKVKRLSEQFALYLDMAIGGELRYGLQFDQEDTWTPAHEKYLPRSRDRGRAWQAWKTIREAAGTEALRVAVDAFENLNWDKGCGGESWARIARVLLWYETGECTPLVFVDTVFSIRHNNGPVFTKSWEVRCLDHVLAAAQREDAERLTAYATPGVRKLYLSACKGRRAQPKIEDEQPITTHSGGKGGKVEWIYYTLGSACTTA